MRNLRNFFERVWADQEGWAFIAYSAANFRQKAFYYPGQLDVLIEELQEKNEWANVYFCPHLFSEPDRKKALAKETVSLWADKDEGIPEDLVPKPTICWQTSDNRYAAIWCLNRATDPQKAEKINRALTYRGKADKGGWHLGKVIRVPGSINHKYSPPQEGFILWEDGPIYDPAQMEHELLPKEEEAATAEAEALHEALENKDTPQQVPAVDEVLRMHGKDFSKSIWDLLNYPPKDDDDWSEGLWKLEKSLAELGLTPEEIFSVVKNSPWNKYKRDQRPDEQLWAEVLKAADSVVEFPQLRQSLPWMGLGNVLVHEERPEWMVEGIWMEKNVGWIAGVGKSYKSTLSLDLALSVASGAPFLGEFRVNKPGPVLLVEEEDPLWRVAYRSQAISRGKGLTKCDSYWRGDKLWMREVVPSKIPLLMSVGGGFSFTDTKKVSELEEAIQVTQPSLVILDPFFMLAPGMDEYKAGEISQVLNLVKHWRNKYGCAVAIVHHYRKGSGEGMERLYGSMALYAWSENSLFVDKQGDKIVIDRDIKDANESDPLSVKFEDIGEEYSFQLGKYDRSTDTKAEDKIKHFLVKHSSNAFSKEDICREIGVSRNSVQKALEKMVKEGIVEKHKAGTGGAALYYPTNELIRVSEGVNLLND